jgi:HK97 family phage portal protein
MKLLDFFRRKSIVTDTATTRDANLAYILGGGPSASGKHVTVNAAMGISAAWSCMRVLSETIGSIPWALYRDTGNGNAEKESDHWLSELLISPNADMTSVEYRELAVLGLSQSGNSYSLKQVAAKGRVTSLMPMKTEDVRVMRKLGSNSKLAIPEGEPFFRVTDRGQPLDLPREKVFHIKGFGSDGLVGLSPISAARETLGGALASEEFGNRFFSQGGLPSATVTIPGWLDQDQRDKARLMLTQMITGLGNAHKFALFEGGMKPEPWGGMPLEDMQFLALRKFSVSEICRFYRVPPHMVMELDKATFSNIEQQSQEFVTYSLLPYFTRIEAAVQKWLLPPGERGKYFLRFNFEGLLRADSTARANFYNSALQNGWMNRNEVRAKENLNRAEGLDAYTVQLNMTTVDKLGKEPVAPKVPVDASADIKDLLQLHVSLPAITVNIPEIKSSPVTVNVPEIKSSPVTVNIPEIKSSPVTVNQAAMHVTIERSGLMRTVVEDRDEDGNIKTLRQEEVH